MMHYKKKRKSTTNMLPNKLHSIPINRSYEEHYKLSHVSNCSIPLVCMVALLGLGVASVNPDSMFKSNANAVEVGNSSNDNAITNNVGDGQSASADLVNESNANEGIMELANVNPSLALTVTNSDKEINTVQGGNTAYSDHLITITGQEVTNYTLSMSSTSSDLTKPSGSSGANITGAGGVTGDSMTANKWGYTVTEESNSSYGGLTYNTVPTTTTTIANGNAASDNTLSVKKKLVFAAKFGEDAAAGSYRQSISLSAVASATMVTFRITYNSNGGGTAPAASTETSTANSATFTLPGQGSMSKSGYTFVGWSTSSTATTGSAAGSSYTVNRTNPQITLYAVWKLTATWNTITTMQEMLPAVCSNAANGATKTFTDTRDNNTYTIVKYGGRCWMQQNLRLKGGRTLTPADSDVTSNWSMPATLNGSGTSVSDWTNDYNKPYSAYFSNTTNGVYYNWTAAIAMSDSSSKTSEDVNTSICPRGWKLPTNSEYSNMLTSEGIANSSAGSTKIRGAPYNYVYAGYVSGGTLGSAGSDGYYWSRTADRANVAYDLYFGSSNVVMSGSNRGRGFSVRCIAKH